MAKLISKTYGDALFDLAIAGEKVDDIFEQSSVLLDCVNENPELINLLTNPKLTKEEKLNVVEKSFAGTFDNDIVGLLKVIVEKDRAKDTGAILTHFKNRVYEYRKTGIVTVTSATALTDAQKKQIEAKLLATTGYVSLLIDWKVDASFIGGMTIRIGDKVVDSTVKHKLEKMTNQLRKAN